MRKYVKTLITGLGLGAMLYCGSAEAAMNYDEAMLYQQANSKEIYVKNAKLRENNHKEVLHKTFNLFKKNGNSNDFGKWGEGTKKAKLNLAVDYSAEENSDNPSVFIGWNYEGPTHSVGNMPSSMEIISLDGYTLTLQCCRDGNYYEADSWVDANEFGEYPQTRYRGRIYLTTDELQIIAEHGEIDSINIDGGRKLLYDLPKQAKERKMFETGIKHAMKILQLD